jgi:hypothetical protein
VPSPTHVREAVRQVLYAALTNPVLAYSVEGVAGTVPTANVIPKDIWRTGGDSAPMPLVSISVASLSAAGWSQNERNLVATVTVVSASDQDQCEEIMEAIRARLHGADTEGLSDAVLRPTNLSRATSGVALGAAIRMIRERHVLPTTYNATDQRWYTTAEYDISAA